VQNSQSPEWGGSVAFFFFFFSSVFLPAPFQYLSSNPSFALLESAQIECQFPASLWTHIHSMLVPTDFRRASIHLRSHQRNSDKTS
jgi:hypothetical protein